MKQNILYLNGMFRSGTTLMTQVLSAHPEMLVVGDPYVYFFKGYRNQFFEDHHQSNWIFDEPMPDYFHDDKIEFFQHLLTTDLQQSIKPHIRKQIADQIVLWKKHILPELCETIQPIQGENFQQGFEFLLKQLQTHYGNSALQILGTKSSWSEEFMPSLIKAFPGLKCLMMLRDPRAITASQNFQVGAPAGKRPLLFYVRQWRKSVNLCQYFRQSGFRDQIKWVKYEDLIVDPFNIVQSISDYIGIDYHPKMASPENFKHFSGGQEWKGNSSFGDAHGFFLSSLDKWKKLLTVGEVEFITTFCEPELKLMNYDISSTSSIDSDYWFQNSPESSLDTMAPWVQKSSISDYLTQPEIYLKELKLEEERINLLKQNKVSDDNSLISKHFLLPEIYHMLRRVYHG